MDRLLLGFQPQPGLGLFSGRDSGVTDDSGSLGHALRITNVRMVYKEGTSSAAARPKWATNRAPLGVSARSPPCSTTANSRRSTSPASRAFTRSLPDESGVVLLS